MFVPLILLVCTPTHSHLDNQVPDAVGTILIGDAAKGLGGQLDQLVMVHSTSSSQHLRPAG